MLEVGGSGVYIRREWSERCWYWRGFVISISCERRLMKVGCTETLTAGLGRSHCSKGLGHHYHQWCWSVADSALERYSLLLPTYRLGIAAGQKLLCSGRA